MIVIDRDQVAGWVKELKRQQDSENRDYYTGYMSALSAVEGLLAIASGYDLGKLIDDAVKRAEMQEREIMDDLAMGF